MNSTKLNDLINDATEEIRSEAKTEDTTSDEDKKVETERKRKELLLLSSDGEVSKSVSYIQKQPQKL